MLAGGPHGLVLTLEVALLVPATATQEEKPCTMDSPMAEGAKAGKVEGARGQRVREMVADGSWLIVSLLYGLRWIAGRWGVPVWSDVLIRGSVPGPLPFLRFIIRDVDENGDVVAGVVVRCIAAFGRSAFAMGYFEALAGRRTGRKAERFMLGGVVWWLLEMKLRLASGNSRCVPSRSGMRVHVAQG